MNFSHPLRSRSVRIIVLLVCLCLFLPALSFAQEAAANPDLPPAINGLNCTIGWTIDLSGCMPLFAAWLGSWFVAFGGAILYLAGTLFDTLIVWIIVNFKGTLDFLKITDAINIVWTVFRDFSNILIIGFFVFIAISIILGLEKFGQKKHVAHVLLIAILMNFSLLFSKIIVDGSNFVAFQIYKQMVGTAPAANAYFDVSDAFLKPMGITSIWQDSGLVTRNVANQTGSALQAFAFGVVAGLLLLAVAAVLLYGCFLIAVRGVLLIFLMGTAAIAFATYLIPAFRDSEYGWSAWWKTLLNAAVFAPLLMFFLWMSLLIIQRAGAARGNSTLGNIITDPKSQLQGDNWVVILVYLIGIGLLFVSFRVANKFAGSISGMGWVPGFGEKLAFAPLRLAAPALRATRGRANAERVHDLEQKAKDEANKQAALKPEKRNYAALEDILRKKSAAEARAKRTYDIAGSPVAQAISRAAGFPGGVKKEGESYAEAAKKRADEAAKLAASVALKSDDAQGIARKQLENEQAGQRATLDAQRSTNAALIQKATEAAENAKGREGLPEKHSQAEENVRVVEKEVTTEKVKIQETHDPAIKGLEQQLISAAAGERAGIQTKLDEARKNRDSELREQDQRIKDANSAAQNIQNQMKMIDRQFTDTNEIRRAKEELASVNEEFKKLDRELENGSEKMRERTQRIMSDTSKAMQGVAAGLTKGQATRDFERATGMETGDKYVLNQARSLTDKKIGVRDIVASRTAENEQLKSANELPSSAPPAPNHPGNDTVH